MAKVYDKGQCEGDHSYGGGFGSASVESSRYLGGGFGLASVESSRYLGWFVTFLTWGLVDWPIEHG